MPNPTSGPDIIVDQINWPPALTNAQMDALVAGQAEVDQPNPQYEVMVVEAEVINRVRVDQMTDAQRPLTNQDLQAAVAALTADRAALTPEEFERQFGGPVTTQAQAAADTAMRDPIRTLTPAHFDAYVPTTRPPMTAQEGLRRAASRAVAKLTQPRHPSEFPMADQRPEVPGAMMPAPF